MLCCRRICRVYCSILVTNIVFFNSTLLYSTSLSDLILHTLFHPLTLLYSTLFSSPCFSSFIPFLPTLPEQFPLNHSLTHYSYIMLIQYNIIYYTNRTKQNCKIKRWKYFFGLFFREIYSQLEHIN